MTLPKSSHIQGDVHTLREDDVESAEFVWAIANGWIHRSRRLCRITAFFG